MEPVYKLDVIPATEQVISLYERAGLPRPTKDAERITRMFANSDLIISAWQGDQLIGICRSITDWAWCCYLSDLAVDPDYKKSGIGKKMIDLTRKEVGEECMVLLLSVPTAKEYYPKVGFSKEDRAFMINRTR